MIHTCILCVIPGPPLAESQATLLANNVVDLHVIEIFQVFSAFSGVCVKRSIRAYIYKLPLSKSSWDQSIYELSLLQISREAAFSLIAVIYIWYIYIYLISVSIHYICIVKIWPCIITPWKLYTSMDQKVTKK